MAKDRAEILMEEVREQYKAIKEGFDTFRNVPTRLDNIETDVSELKSDMQVVKGVLREHSADITEIKSGLVEIKLELRGYSADIAELKTKTT